MINNIEVNAIITAAGSGSRMGIDTPKQFLKIGKMTVIERVFKKLSQSYYIDKIYIVSQKENFSIINELLKNKKYELVEGGSSREESTYLALKKIKDKDSLVLTHDCARPFISTEQIDRIIEEGLKSESTIYAVREIDSIKLVENGLAIENLNRDLVYRVQTPQLFKTRNLQLAFERYIGKENFTDDSSYVEKLGIKTKVLEGSYDNFKITTKSDLRLAKLLAEEEDNEDR